MQQEKERKARREVLSSYHLMAADAAAKGVGVISTYIDGVADDTMDMLLPSKKRKA